MDVVEKGQSIVNSAVLPIFVIDGDKFCQFISSEPQCFASDRPTSHFADTQRTFSTQRFATFRRINKVGAEILASVLL